MAGRDLFTGGSYIFKSLTVNSSFVETFCATATAKSARSAASRPKNWSIKGLIISPKTI